MQDVTQEEFFAALHADPRDIMPFVSPTKKGGYRVSEWRTNDNSRILFGKSWGENYQLVIER